MGNYQSEDFFGEEYEKKQQEQAEQQNQQQEQSNETINAQSSDRFSLKVDQWHSGGSGGGGGVTQQQPNRKVTVAVIAVAMVMVFIFGFLFASLFVNGKVKVLSEVINTIENKYLNGEKLTEEDWIAIIEAGGTAMFQETDRYGMLLSPQSAYDLIYPKEEEPSPNGYFGFGYQAVKYMGLFVNDVSVDSSAYGKLQPYDFIVKLDNMTDAYGNTVAGGSLVLDNVSTETMENAVDSANAMTVTVLRDGELYIYDLQRGNIGSRNNQTDQFAFVTYYFGANNTNASTSPENGAAVSTVEQRKLAQLPADVGYIHLNEYSQFDNGTSCDFEVKTALDKFKASGKTKLVLDLKGNPGGYVNLAANIIGLLADTERADLKDKDGGILAASLEDRNGRKNYYYAEPSYCKYSDYFEMPVDGGKKNIVIWTDGGSASASELTTGALLDYGTAIQMGQTTYGKGIAQSVEPIIKATGTVINNDGKKDTFYWCVYYTSSMYYSPLATSKEDNIHGKGYTPAAPYNNLDTYQKLVDATANYWN
ncbi:MAG: S41 family peptidase [Corallococcus sp.]|nr:S41 family peptidase [Corallococcus sp.]